MDKDKGQKDKQRSTKHTYKTKEQTTQWTKDKGQKDKQRSTKHTYKTREQTTQ